MKSNNSPSPSLFNFAIAFSRAGNFLGSGSGVEITLSLNSFMNLIASSQLSKSFIAILSSFFSLIISTQILSGVSIKPRAPTTIT